MCKLSCFYKFFVETIQAANVILRATSNFTVSTHINLKQPLPVVFISRSFFGNKHKLHQSPNGSAKQFRKIGNFGL